MNEYYSCYYIKIRFSKLC